MDKIVRVVKLPSTVRGITVPDKDGVYNIYINKDMAYNMQVKTYYHETTHIENNDFCDCQPVMVLEGRVRYK
jgi:hypothetical protein